MNCCFLWCPARDRLDKILEGFCSQFSEQFIKSHKTSLMRKKAETEESFKSAIPSFSFGSLNLIYRVAKLRLKKCPLFLEGLVTPPSCQIIRISRLVPSFKTLKPGCPSWAATLHSLKSDVDKTIASRMFVCLTSCCANWRKYALPRNKVTID